MKKYTKNQLGLATALMLGFFWGSAQAASVADSHFIDELNQYSDNDAESIGEDNFSDDIGTGGTNGFLNVGDTIRGISEIETIEDLTGGGGTNNLGGGGPNNEFTAIFEAEVVSRTFVGVGNDGVAGTGDDLYDFVFGPDADFATEWEGNLGLAAGTLSGAIFLLFDDPTFDFNRTGTIAAGETSATDGTLIFAYGFNGEADELFLTQGAEQDVDLSDVAPGTAVGTFQFQMTRLLNNTSLSFVQVDAGTDTADGGPCSLIGGRDCMIDLNGSGSALGTSGISGEYPIFTNFDAVVRPVSVPEPASIALLGIGLLGLGAGRRRRQHNKNGAHEN